MLPEEKNGCLKSFFSSPKGGPYLVYGKPNSRKKLEAVGTWSGELQSVENASSKLNQCPVWNSFGGRNLGQFAC